MAVTTFAAIDVGSNEVTMKIYEISKKNGIKEIDHIRHTIELGSETYSFGSLSHGLIDELCDVLNGFNQIMKEYDIQTYTAYTTSSIREASNNLMILDQIKLRCNLKVKILSNSEQRFLCYQALAMKERTFNQMIEDGTLILDVGPGSIQLSLFHKGALTSTQNILLGPLRIRELLSSMENQTSNLNQLLSEYIDNELLTYEQLWLRDFNVSQIIAIGDHLHDLVKLTNQMQYSKWILAPLFLSEYEQTVTKSIEEISRTLNLSKEQATLVHPTFMIYQKMLSLTGAKQIWFSDISLCDGMVFEYAAKKTKVEMTHNFTDDILMAARNIARRYHCNLDHVNHVDYISCAIYDSMKKIHGLGKRERLYLQLAAILHACGEFLNMNKVTENSYAIVMSTEIIGLSHFERQLVANLVRYDTRSFPKHSQLLDDMDKETYLKTAKLTAILRLANSLDKSHKQKSASITASLKDNCLIVTVNTIYDITLERGLFEQKCQFFEDVFGIRPILKQKRI